MSAAQQIRLVVPGRPVPNKRPRLNKRRGTIHTPAESSNYQERIKAEWMVAGRPRLADGVPIIAYVDAYYSRPGAHLRVRGGLTAAGQRSQYPTPQADLDNVVKQLDALNGLAFKDDRYIVEIHARRIWASAGVGDRLVILLQPAPLEVVEAGA